MMEEMGCLFPLGLDYAVYEIEKRNKKQTKKIRVAFDKFGLK